MVLIRPGATDFDEQGRIKGTLDIPLNEQGNTEVAQTISELADVPVEMVYSAPCQAALQTAEAVAAARRAKCKTVEELRNLDHGLWHGKLIEEVRQCQPKVYRQWQEHPETVCPPGGETLGEAQDRLRASIGRIIKKHRSGVIAVVMPEPAASLVRCFLSDTELGNLWKAECDHGGWQLIEVEPQKLAAST
ncbi:MAG TPA: histidine phosphatase family protein [Devosia sp.]|nr:histidine phosphatase family protein [Devosia sp.]